ncbi:hypothetical protein [Helicobacter burdigaliensis]|uniref:hypothetical protein n=1 Tax=Helicobacter burdigaliensis TaxID=2315334 RepID=UPI000EF6C1B1|nr:hypothetical protein [Helicobacter burdigaliensis]
MRDRRELIWQLKKHGLDLSKLEVMPTNELIELFKQESKKKLLEHLEYVKNKQKEVALEEIEDNQSLKKLSQIKQLLMQEELDFIKLYEVIEEFLEDYTLNEATDLILTQTSDRRYKQVTQIVELCFRCYQEKLLSKIEELCASYPAEELSEQMKFYSKKREHIAFLREAIASLEAKGAKEKLSNMAQYKFEILRDYYPDFLYENYENFYEDANKKEKVIENILKLTNAYKRKVLKNKRLKTLEQIERVLINDRNKEKEEKILIKQFTKRFAEVIAIEDEIAFGLIIKEALEVLDERDVRKIINNFDLGSNPMMIQQLNNALRGNKSVR